MKKRNSLILLFLLILLANNQETDAYDLEKGKNVFNQNCLACHEKGRNVIIPEKNLKRLTLEANGMYSHEAIIYQVLNGKNGMPAFGGRLNQTEIDNVAEYVIISAESNFEN
jgi:cytochrome c6